MMKPTAEGPRFKSVPEILAECATARHRSGHARLPLLFQGARAAHTFLALKEAGFKNLRMYSGSWNEWSRDPSLPIEEGYPAALAA